MLPAGVAITPVSELPGEVRGQIEHQPGDHCVTRPQTRSVSSVVDGSTASLLERFREPTTIVDAVLAFAAADGLDPAAMLDSAYGTLAALVEDELLVPADSPLARPLAATLSNGMVLEGVEILGPVHLLDDTEVYRGRTADGRLVALKIAGEHALRQAVEAIHNEGEVLQLLDGHVNPPLIDVGSYEDRPFIVTPWRSGVDLYQAAADARRLAGRAAQAELLGICTGILGSYAHLHGQGVLHGDVQPRNLLVAGFDRITILDFGLAAAPAAGIARMRGGVDIFQAPEIAAARLAGDDGPAPTFASEQYAVAAVLYLTIAGSQTHPFSLAREEMLRQIVEDDPTPFARHDLGDLGEVETCLRRALSKVPAARYPSSDDFSAAFQEATGDFAQGSSSPRRREDGLEPLEPLLAATGIEGELWREGLPKPQASLAHGAAGIAYASLRLSRLRDDPDLLARADLWATRAAAAVEEDGAFWNRELGIVPEVFGRASLFHHAAGVHWVGVLVAQARGDDSGQARALGSFLAAAGAEKTDVVFGHAGLLLGAATLLEALGGDLDLTELRAFGEAATGGVLSWLEGDEPDPLLGAAHGRSGGLYAVLRWCEASGRRPPALQEELKALARCGERWGRGMRWPRRAGERPDDSLLTASWCNGAAGHVHLWNQARRLYGDEEFDRLAEAAAWTAHEAAPGAPGELCCGLAGRAYALLDHYRQSGDRRWLERARVVGARASSRLGEDDSGRHGLLHGDLGIALLTAELEEPDFARMPIFAAEGWSRGR